jgi:hypothetical protein
MQVEKSIFYCKIALLIFQFYHFNQQLVNVIFQLKNDLMFAADKNDD